jgi:hypothetical protein
VLGGRPSNQSVGESWKGAFVGGDLLVHAVTRAPEGDAERLFGNFPNYSAVLVQAVEVIDRVQPGEISPITARAFDRQRLLEVGDERPERDDRPRVRRQ